MDEFGQIYDYLRSICRSLNKVMMTSFFLFPQLSLLNFLLINPALLSFFLFYFLSTHFSSQSHFNLFIRSMDDARLSLRIIAILHAVCGRYPAVHYSEFYNDALNDYCMNSKEVSQVFLSHCSYHSSFIY